MPLRTLLKDCVPPLALGLYRRYLRPYGYRGYYPSWAAAQAAAEGYDAPDVMAAIVASARRSYRGEEALPPLSWRLLAACQAASPPAAGRGPVTVLDFGGALGITWLNLRPWLADASRWRCAVVEQPPRRGRWPSGIRPPRPAVLWRSAQRLLAAG